MTSERKPTTTAINQYSQDAAVDTHLYDKHLCVDLWLLTLTFTFNSLAIELLSWPVHAHEISPGQKSIGSKIEWKQTYERADMADRTTFPSNAVCNTNNQQLHFDYSNDTLWLSCHQLNTMNSSIRYDKRHWSPWSILDNPAISRWLLYIQEYRPCFWQQEALLLQTDRATRDVSQNLSTM